MSERVPSRKFSSGPREWQGRAPQQSLHSPTGFVGQEKKCIQNFGEKNLFETHHLES